jgi:hypothetical protein
MELIVHSYQKKSQLNNLLILSILISSANRPISIFEHFLVEPVRFCLPAKAAADFDLFHSCHEVIFNSELYCEKSGRCPDKN